MKILFELQLVELVPCLPDYWRKHSRSGSPGWLEPLEALLSAADIREVAGVWPPIRDHMENVEMPRLEEMMKMFPYDRGVNLEQTREKVVELSESIERIDARVGR